MDRTTATTARLPIFAKLEPRSMEAVAALAREVSKPAGKVLIYEGEAAESFYVIVSGLIHIGEMAGSSGRCAMAVSSARSRYERRPIARPPRRVSPIATCWNWAGTSSVG